MSEEEKQDYLRTHIINCGYDANEFVEYLNSKFGENATDLEQYTFVELKSIVTDFTANYKPCQQNAEDENDNQEEKQADKEEEAPIGDSKNQDILTQTSQVIQQENYEENLTCEKLTVSKIANQDFKVVLSKPEKKEGGLFSKSYITYLITTANFSYEVRRRYSDFDWLRSTLISYFPSSWIPPIPLKNFSERFESEFIDKRMRYLQQFIDSVMANPTFCASCYFHDFISIKLESDFTNAKKAYAKEKLPVKLNEMKSLDGSVSSIICFINPRFLVSFLQQQTKNMIISSFIKALVSPFFKN